MYTFGCHLTVTMLFHMGLSSAVANLMVIGVLIGLTYNISVQFHNKALLDA